MVDTFNIHSNCNVVVLYYCSVNSIICRVIDVFKHAEIARWYHCNVDNLKR